MKTIAIIPARSGSKGLKDKNIKLLNGKPLLAYTIEAALKSNVFDKVMVSTDSLKYASIAKKYGAEVPFLRSKKASNDKAKTSEVIKEVINNYKKNGKTYDVLCILQPTSPLRNSRHIKAAYKLLLSTAKVGVVSVCEMDHCPLWLNVLPENLSLDKFINNKNSKKRRQNVRKFYRINGALYFAYVNEYMKNDNLYRKGSVAYIMDKKFSVDIDDIFDFKYAEFLLKSF